MVDSHSESYAVQERELKKLLPNVSPDVIKHFLTQYHGNMEECYQRLRVITPQPQSPDNMEPFFQMTRTSTVSTSNPSLYHQSQSYRHQHQPQPHQYQDRHHPSFHQQPPPPSSQQNDHRTFRRQQTVQPYYSQTLPNPRRSQTNVHLPPVDTPHYGYGGGHAGTPNVDPGYRWGQYGCTNAAGESRQLYNRQSSAWAASLPRRREMVHPNFGVMAVNLFAAQQQQLEALQRHQEEEVRQLTYMRQMVESKQQQLGQLRIEVSAIPSPQQMSELEEVIQTLEIDLRDARNQLQVQTVQSKMKEEQDLYTEEGVRWYCEDCSFLNHPLMTLCEKCSIPRARSAS